MSSYWSLDVAATEGDGYLVSAAERSRHDNAIVQSESFANADASGFANARTLVLDESSPPAQMEQSPLPIVADTERGDVDGDVDMSSNDSLAAASADAKMADEVLVHGAAVSFVHAAVGLRRRSLGWSNSRCVSGGQTVARVQHINTTRQRCRLRSSATNWRSESHAGSAWFRCGCVATVNGAC